jgi:hypothetical protein
MHAVLQDRCYVTERAPLYSACQHFARRWMCVFLCRGPRLAGVLMHTQWPKVMAPRGFLAGLVDFCGCAGLACHASGVALGRYAFDRWQHWLLAYKLHGGLRVVDAGPLRHAQTT